MHQMSNAPRARRFYKCLVHTSTWDFCLQSVFQGPFSQVSRSAIRCTPSLNLGSLAALVCYTVSGTFRFIRIHTNGKLACILLLEVSPATLVICVVGQTVMRCWASLYGNGVWSLLGAIWFLVTLFEGSLVRLSSTNPLPIVKPSPTKLSRKSSSLFL
jgi:hypothetical protein